MKHVYSIDTHSIVLGSLGRFQYLVGIHIPYKNIILPSPSHLSRQGRSRSSYLILLSTSRHGRTWRVSCSAYIQ